MADPPKKILTDPGDYILELSSTGRAPETTPADSNDSNINARPFLSIFFKCCNVYSRIYRNQAADAYAGNCPKCARHLRVPIGPGGSSKRTFVAE